MTRIITDPKQFFKEVFQKVPAYKDFMLKNGGNSESRFESLPLVDKKNYLLTYPIQELCWNGSIESCHLIGSSSGFSKTGSVFWPKRPSDEAEYVQSIEKMLSENYGIDKKRTLIFCCMALGTWIGGMTLTSALRILASQGKNPITIVTPGLNFGEAVEIYSRFYSNFEQTLWITNPSSINIILALLNHKGVSIPAKSNFFPVVGEYYSEVFRENISSKFGFSKDEPYVIWTGYGSADTGDLSVETAATIALRKFIHRNRNLSEKIFNTSDTPMILDVAPDPFIEIINNQIVVTKDQLVPLVRYNTGDEGGLLYKKKLKELHEFPKEIIEPLRDKMIYVFGRASDSIIFYGTNINVKNIHNYFLSLPEKYGYDGLFQVKPVESEGVTSYDFKIFVHDFSNEALRKLYSEMLIEFLKKQSLEFSAKYTNLTNSLGRELISVHLDDITGIEGKVKHKFIVN